MSREIKFRAWNGKKMLIVGDMHWSVHKGWSWNSRRNKEGMYNYGSGNLMQYTGLKDTNGIAIYEGDIVSHNWLTATVVFDRGGFRAMYRGDEHFYGGSNYYDLLIAGVEVVGNIHQNPELLKGGDEVAA